MVLWWCRSPHGLKCPRKDFGLRGLVDGGRYEALLKQVVEVPELRFVLLCKQQSVPSSLVDALRNQNMCTAAGYVSISSARAR